MSYGDYYPYGKVLREFNPQAEKYLTTHHERDTETGLDYRGARYYDSDNSRLLSLDEKQAEYPSWSPYCYVAGNPIILVDPDGRDWDGFIDGLKDKAQSYVANKVSQLANAIVATATSYVDNKYLELKQSLEEGNTEIKVSAKATIPLGIYGEEKITVLEKGEGVKLDLLSTDLFGVEAGVKLDKNGFSFINEVEYPGDKKGVLVRNSISATYGVGSANAENQFRVTDIDAGAKGVRDENQTVGGSVGGVGVVGYERNLTKNRNTVKSEFSGGIGLGIGIRGSMGIEVSKDDKK